MASRVFMTAEQVSESVKQMQASSNSSSVDVGANIQNQYAVQVVANFATVVNDVASGMADSAKFAVELAENAQKATSPELQAIYKKNAEAISDINDSVKGVISRLAAKLA